MQRTGHRDVRSLQKYQRPEISTKIEFSKAFDTSNEAVSLSGSIGSQKAPLKREVELEEESTRKFSKSCDEARIPETKAITNHPGVHNKYLKLSENVWVIRSWKIWIQLKCKYLR